MKAQWWLLIGLIFAIIVAIFAVVNDKKVPVNYVFGEAQWPLVLVIIGAALLGALLSISFATYKILSKSLELKQVKKELHVLQQKFAEQTTEPMKPLKEKPSEEQ
ncbi:LapA family protein [Kurthia sibirica]|uniref:DUF1049 domain-containing protein n=1 Tax=Kurthia sibirica TaxID=202750 RepID=A0A2U3AIN2_9BACL|nr:lipopolysaccharide assembly protein LapA domain-containing protein [Kurthia sibirica]PWI24344.1 DUF1049 domain-containing protein [Kurthia sibirica]GEK34369.1 hypothetical protein KSI01_19020 [Kurthia sibirica]